MKQQHQTLIIAGAGIVAVALLYFGVMPKMNTLSTLRASAEIKSREADAVVAQVSDLKKLATELTQNAAQLNTLKSALPTEKKIDEAFIMINEIAHASGVELTNVQPKSGNAQIGELQISLSAIGDYESLIRFTKNLRSNQRLTIVKSVSFSAKATRDMGDGQKTTQLSGSFDIAMAISASPAAVQLEKASTTGGASKASTQTNATRGAR